jgi:sugar lactone lactonase YvrE
MLVNAGDRSMAADTIKLEPVAHGYYLEALLVEGTTVWYSDVVEGGIKRLTADASVTTWLPERRMVGGLLLNEDGCVLVSGAGGVVWFNPASNATGVLVDSVAGEPLKGVNEMRPDGKGGMYFGGSDMPAIERGVRPGPVGLYRLDANRHATQLCDGLVFTNGLTPNRDGSRLFHNESFVGTFAYDVLPDGSLTNRTQLLKKKDCDGMALDAEGNLWVSGFASGEILRVQPDGTIVQRITLPGDAATNVRFGGADGRDLYITVVSTAAAMSIKDGVMPTAKTSTLYRGRSDVAGQPIARTRFRLG